MAGFAAAFELVDMVETDVRRSVDGELVLAHYPWLGDLAVAETPWAVLAELDLGDGHGPARLVEALAAFPDRRFDLEVKNSPLDPGFEEDLALAADTARVARPGDLVSSFYWPNVDLVREVEPEVATGLLVDDGVPVAEAIRRATAAGHVAVIPRWTLLVADPGLIEQTHDAGLEVVTWTVNDPGIARRLVEDGVDAIITDDPGTMVSVMAKVESEAG